MPEKVRLVGLRLIEGFNPFATPFPFPGFATISPSPTFPPGPHPVSIGRQRIISPRPIDLKKSESRVVLPACSRGRRGSVVKAMVVRQAPFGSVKFGLAGRAVEPVDRDYIVWPKQSMCQHE